jgi:menaquinol-cytochrome c reductase iron-sulfur subunit
MSRRRFLLWLGNLGLLLSAWGIGQGLLRFLDPPVTQPQPEPVPVGPPAQFALNSLTFIPAAVAWLGHDGTGFYALSAVCPHLGCTVRQSEGQFECPCHGSQFAEDGEVLTGPASRPMSYLAVTLVEDQLVIDPAKPVSPERRLEA